MPSIENEDAVGPAYRAKLMDAAGRIETTIGIMASNETEAMEQIRGLTMSYTVELWEAGRLIIRLPMRSA